MLLLKQLEEDEKARCRDLPDRGSFVGVGEAVEVGELHGPGVMGDETEGAACFDRGELGGDRGIAVVLGNRGFRGGE